MKYSSKLKKKIKQPLKKSKKSLQKTLVFNELISNMNLRTTECVKGIFVMERLIATENIIGNKTGNYALIFYDEFYNKKS